VLYHKLEIYVVTNVKTINIINFGNDHVNG